MRACQLHRRRAYLSTAEIRALASMNPKPTCEHACSIDTERNPTAESLAEASATPVPACKHADPTAVERTLCSRDADRGLHAQGSPCKHAVPPMWSASLPKRGWPKPPQLHRLPASRSTTSPQNAPSTAERLAKAPATPD